MTALLIDALAQKTTRVERCIARAREEYAEAADFLTDRTHQDAAILNLQRACELAIDMGNMVIAHEQWGLPQSAREVFSMLADRGLIAADMALNLQRMVGFRNVAVHEYDTLDIRIVVRVIEHDVDAVLQFASQVLNHYLKPSSSTQS